MSAKYRLSIDVPSEDVDQLRKAANSVNSFPGSVYGAVHVTVESIKGGVSNVTIWYDAIGSLWLLAFAFGSEMMLYKIKGGVHEKS